MSRFSFCGFFALVLLGLVAPAVAEHQVTLLTGATLVGEVSMEGKLLVVDVDGVKLRMPFKDVATVTSIKTVTSVKTYATSQAQRLLFKALEAQLLFGGEDKELGLLSEAFRLAPDDAHVAYWYARSLAFAGYGKRASEIFQEERTAIAAAYPGFADELGKLIEARLKIELLPAPLVKRLDHIAAMSNQITPFLTEKSPYAAYFRIVDQHDDPIEASSFRITCNGGENQKLASFPDGYHLYTFLRRNSYQDNACRLEVSRTGLAAKTFEFHGATYGAKDEGVFRVRRLEDEDRLFVVVTVVDPDGKPLSGAKVSFSARNTIGRGESIPAETTSSEGRVEARLFPGSFHCQAVLKGYNPSSQTIAVAEDEKRPIAVEVTLHKQIPAKAKVVWQSTMVQPPGRPDLQNETRLSGQMELTIGSSGSSYRHHPYPMQWVRLMQTGEKVQLQFTEQRNYPAVDTGATWIGRVKETSEAAASTDERFEQIDLSKLDEMKDQLKLLRPNLTGVAGRPTPLIVPAVEGAIYVGKIHSRAPQIGRLALFEFKVLVTKPSEP